MARIPDSPCLGCANRHISCHAGCDNYKAYRQKLDAHNAEVRKRKHDEHIMAGYYADLSERAKKRKSY